jgi:hypothetical protein
VGEPRRIRRIDRESAIIVRGAVIPPNVATLAQVSFHGVHCQACCDSFLGIGGISECLTGSHEFPNQTFVRFRSKPWITEPPQSASNDKIPAVRSGREIRLHPLQVWFSFERYCSHAELPSFEFTEFKGNGPLKASERSSFLCRSVRRLGRKPVLAHPGRMPFLIRSLTAIVVLLMVTPLQFACAQVATPSNESSISLYGGDRFGGSAVDATTHSSIHLQDGSSAAVALDLGLDPNRQIELFYSHQSTALTNVSLILHNYHIGGTVFFEELGRGPYVVGGIGGTTAEPGRSGLNSETFFSGNLGIGWMMPLGSHVGLRFEARGYGIVLRNNGTLFCGGSAGCTVSIKGSALYQGELLGGLSFRF